MTTTINGYICARGQRRDGKGEFATGRPMRFTDEAGPGKFVAVLWGATYAHHEDLRRGCDLGADVHSVKITVYVPPSTSDRAVKRIQKSGFDVLRPSLEDLVAVSNGWESLLLNFDQCRPREFLRLPARLPLLKVQ